MLTLKIIGSSSKGNCYLLSNNDTTIMLDCGTKKILKEDLTKVDGIFISHIHGDHCSAYRHIKNYYSGKYYVNEYLNEHLFGNAMNYKKDVVELKAGEKFQIGTFSCTTFNLIHDVPNLGILIKDTISNTKLLYITDTGMINCKFKDVDYILIESNCDEDLLTYEDYKEVRLYDTHLSLQQTGQFLLKNTNHNTKKVILCHISTSEQDYLKHERYVKQVLNNENIEVIAIDPHMQKSLEIVLKEDLGGFNFE